MESNLTPIDAVSVDITGGTTESHSVLTLTVKVCHHRAEPTQQYMLFIKSMGETMLKVVGDYMLTYQGEYTPKDNSNSLRFDPVEFNVESYPERVVVIDDGVVGDIISNIFRNLADDSSVQ